VAEANHKGCFEDTPELRHWPTETFGWQGGRGQCRRAGSCLCPLARAVKARQWCTEGVGHRGGACSLNPKLGFPPFRKFGRERVCTATVATLLQTRAAAIPR